MLVFADFASPAVVLPACLAGGGALMAWRGAHLSGDQKRKHSVSWAAGSVVTFLVALAVGAISNHESNKEIVTANRRADESDGKLILIQNDLSVLKAQNSALADAIGRIASKANVDPTLTTKDLALQVINKLSAFENASVATENKVSALEHPLPDPDLMYQAGKIRAKFVSASYNQSNNEIFFPEIDEAGQVDWGKSIQFRGLDLDCYQHENGAGIEMTTRGAVTNVVVNVKCNVISGKLNKN